MNELLSPVEVRAFLTVLHQADVTPDMIRDVIADPRKAMPLLWHAMKSDHQSLENLRIDVGIVEKLRRLGAPTLDQLTRDCSVRTLEDCGLEDVEIQAVRIALSRLDMHLAGDVVR